MFGRKPKLFQQDIDPRCAYCAKGALLEGGQVLCTRRGLVKAGSSCPSFRYDPFKRVPPKPVQLNTEKLRQEDFRLD